MAALGAASMIDYLSDDVSKALLVTIERAWRFVAED